MVVEYTNIIPFDTLFSPTTNQFLNPFVDIVDTDIRNKMRLTFEISERQRERKITPILQLARPQDAKAIVNIYLDIYKGMYPYKEMEDVSEVKRMIESSEYH